MAPIAGLAAPAVFQNDVRGMTEADRAALRACEDPEALLELRLQLLAANGGGARRAVALSIGGVGILAGILIINMASTLAIGAALVALVGLFAFSFGIQARARKRAIRTAEWLGILNFRLQQLASAA